MMRWLDHHRLNGCQFEKTPGDSGGQGCLACCNPWGRKELDPSQQLNNNIMNFDDKPMWGQNDSK